MSKVVLSRTFAFPDQRRATFAPFAGQTGPDVLRVVEEREPGKGGVIEIPIARAASNIDSSLTANESVGRISIDVEDFEQMVGNFDAWPGPKTVYLSPHDTTRNPRPSTARALGTITKIWVVGDQLWGRLSLNRLGWEILVQEQSFFSFSIEAEFNPLHPNAQPDGWVLTGGIFTNTPVLDVQFIAASRGDKPHATIQLTLPCPWGVQEGAMPQTAEQIAAEKKAADDKAAKDKADMERLTAENATLKTENQALKAAAPGPPAPANADLQTIRADLTSTQSALAAEKKRNDTLEAASRVRDVREVVTAALAEGKPPSFFEGWDSDPAKFLNDRFGGSLDALRANVSRLPKQSFGTRGVESGQPADPGADGPKGKLDAEVKKIASERKLTYAVALEAVRQEKPDVYRAGIDAWANEKIPTDSSRSS